MIDPQWIFDRSCELLTTTENCLLEAGITPPTHTGISACDPVLACCDAIWVYPYLIVPIETPGTKGRCAVQYEYHWQLIVSRCVVEFTHEGNLPADGDCTTHKPGTVTGDAFTVLADREVLTHCLVRSLRTLSCDDEPRALRWGCRPLSLIAITPECQGGCAGTRFELTLTI